MNMISEFHPVITKIMDLINPDHTYHLMRKRDLSTIVSEVKEATDELGRTIIQEMITAVDESLIESENRKKQWSIQRRDQAKTIATALGPIEYKRTYFRNNRTGDYSHLADEQIHVTPHQKIDLGLQVQLLESAKETSYQKTVDRYEHTGITSRTTIMNYVHRMGMIESSECPIPERKSIKRIFIEADEDHVAMQRTGNQQLKLIYVHEGHKKVSKRRTKLINPKFFTGFYNGRSDELWYEVLSYLDAAYDLENVHEICLSGDGASWIKTGLGVIPKSKYYLDRFHLEKYLKKASNPIESAWGTNGKYLWKLRDEIKLGNKREVAILLDSYMGYGRTQSQEEAIAESKAYIMNNWEGIQNSLESDYRGCSAEGHVSHVLSDRLSSRPLGWSLKGAEHVARLRVFGLNGGNLGEYYLEKARKKRHEDRVIRIEKHILRKKAKYPVREGSINYATPHFGWYRSV